MTKMTEQEAREMEARLTIHAVGAVRITNQKTGEAEVVGAYPAEDIICLLDQGMDIRAVINLLRPLDY